MKLVALPDFHEDLRHLDELAALLAEVDLVVLPGDLTNHGGATGARLMLQAVQCYQPQVLAVPGNWDTPAACAALDAAGVSLHGRYRNVAGVGFVGVGGSLRSIAPTPNEQTEEQLAATLASCDAARDPDVPLVLVCHQPPINTLNDRTWGGLHVGSHTIRQWIETVQPVLCLTGHIHEGVGIDRIGRTQVVNPGPLPKGGYAYAEILADQLIVECRRLPNTSP